MSTTTITEKTIWDWLKEVKDPEVPALSVVDLGVVRAVDFNPEKCLITITPTYSGCPAMKVIEDDIISCLTDNGVANVEVKTILSPAWTTDWITLEGRRALKEYGIAPPRYTSPDKNSIMGIEKEIPCPQCNSTNTKMLSQFGSTACKALYKCNDCLEPFDYFKCI